MVRHVQGSIGAHLDEAGRSGGGTHLPRGFRDGVRQAERPRQRGEVRSRRRGDELLVGAGLSVFGYREEVEYPPAAVVRAHDRQLEAEPPAREQRAEVVEQRELSGEDVRVASARGRGTEG